MTQPKLPKQLIVNGYVYGHLYPGDSEAIVIYQTWKSTSTDNFFIMEHEFTVDLPEVEPVAAQVKAIREHINQAKGEFEKVVTDKNAEIQKLLSIGWESGTRYTDTYQVES